MIELGISLSSLFISEPSQLGGNIASAAVAQRGFVRLTPPENNAFSIVNEETSNLQDITNPAWGGSFEVKLENEETDECAAFFLIWLTDPDTNKVKTQLIDSVSINGQITIGSSTCEGSISIVGVKVDDVNGIVLIDGDGSWSSIIPSGLSGSNAHASIETNNYISTDSSSTPDFSISNKLPFVANAIMINVNLSVSDGSTGGGVASARINNVTIRAGVNAIVNNDFDVPEDDDDIITFYTSVA